jgi:septal ring factor EnvC (AmiA/AmiB activator)
MDGSAQVIPFRPRAARPDPSATGPVTSTAEGQDRLTRALASLDAALAEQQEAMDQFRLALGDLDRAVAGLEAGLVQYGDDLSTLNHDIDRLGIEARALEGWADEALAKGR